ncbi:MAG TPA: hypothetical protein VMW25_02710 [Clostridia bacterium]|nr:hypothetical protein [Clostridia bacterium]
MEGLANETEKVKVTASSAKGKIFFRPLFLVPILLVWVVALGFGFWYLSKAKTSVTPPPASGVRISKEGTEKPSFDLVIESPKEEAVVVDNKVLVKGKTAVGAVVAVYSDSDEIALETDENGVFEGEVGLLEGINTLTVSAFGANGEEKTVVLDIVYDTQS